MNESKPPIFSVGFEMKSFFLKVKKMHFSSTQSDPNNQARAQHLSDNGWDEVDRIKVILGRWKNAIYHLRSWAP